MSAVNRDGVGVEIGRVERWRGRGAKLSEAEIQRYRDLICWILRYRVGLTPTDTARVFSKGATIDHITERIKDIHPAAWKRLFQRV